MLVASAGTGGTITGVARKLKEKCPGCKVSDPTAADGREVGARGRPPRPETQAPTWARLSPAASATAGGGPDPSGVRASGRQSGLCFGAESSCRFCFQPRVGAGVSLCGSGSGP